jgi:phenylalanyl-tRNA synthetase beta chain
MKLSYSWLKEHLKTEASLAEIVSQLNTTGLVVDHMENLGETLKDFKVGEVVHAEQHPNADRLRVCRVNTGSEEIQVVCGAPNARTGIKVVLARSGMTIPASGLVLKKTAIRGVESNGMICSASELGLGDDQGKIIEVDENAPVGVSYSEYLGLDDSVMDLEITPNRSDCLSVLGVARDLAASDKGTLVPFKAESLKGAFQPPLKLLREFQEDEKACSFFAGRLIRGVKNGPSPLWLQKRLKSIGLKPISALVDITNYILFDVGRPLHVFDYAKIKGNLHIRFARKGEKLVALDGKEYALDEGMTVVADDQSVCSLAGIIGGQSSGCSEETTDVFLESAYFDPVRTTQTGRKLNIITDSRYRFERGVDPLMVLPGLEKATTLILEICGGEASEIISIGTLPVVEKSISFHPSRVKSLGGVEIEAAQQKAILEKLGFEIQTGQGKDGFVAKSPSWRHDIAREADLVEEVLRITGYDQIPALDLPKPNRQEKFKASSEISLYESRQWMLRRALSARGYHEAFTWSFLKPSVAELFGGKNEALILENPISADLAVMRPSLLPNLLQAALRNLHRGIKDNRLFEIGAFYEDIAPDGQKAAVTGVMIGNRAPRHFKDKAQPIDFFDIKEDLFDVLETSGITRDKCQTVRGAPSWYHPSRSAAVMQGPKTTLAVFGQVHPKVLKEFDLEEEVFAFEVYLSNLPLLKEKALKKAIEFSPYQTVERDFAFIFDGSTEAQEIIKTVVKVDQSLIKKVEIFDVYEGKGIPEGKKSIAFSIRIEPQKATLTEDEINTLSQKIIEAVKVTTGGELRI